jgi:hypothetical protein
LFFLPNQINATINNAAIINKMIFALLLMIY